MAEISAELVYEVLEQVQHDISQIKEQGCETNAALNALRGHLVALQQDVGNVYGILGRLDARVDRIERRLELTDAPSL
jgi:hypothetical protein